MSRLSVIVVAYNAEKTIERCIDSVLESESDCEVVAVDDASTDGTAEVLKKYGGRIKVKILDKNCGCVAKTRNIGLAEASGDFFTFLDADDCYEPGAVEKLVERIKHCDADIIKFNYTRVYADGKRIKISDGTDCFRYVQKDDFVRRVYPFLINGIGLNSVCCAAFRKDAIGEVRFDEKMRTAEDAAFAAQAYTRADSVLFTGEYLYCYYQSDGGLTGSGMSVFRKFWYNCVLSAKILKLLPQWGMDTFIWRVKTLMRPFKVAADKLKRNLHRTPTDLSLIHI